MGDRLGTLDAVGFSLPFLLFLSTLLIHFCPPLPVLSPKTFKRRHCEFLIIYCLWHYSILSVLSDFLIFFSLFQVWFKVVDWILEYMRGVCSLLCYLYKSLTIIKTTNISNTIFFCCMHLIFLTDSQLKRSSVKFSPFLLISGMLPKLYKKEQTFLVQKKS